MTANSTERTHETEQGFCPWLDLMTEHSKKSPARRRPEFDRKYGIGVYVGVTEFQPSICPGAAKLPNLRLLAGDC